MFLQYAQGAALLISSVTCGTGWPGSCNSQDVRRDYDGAEEAYKRALECDPTDAATLCNYGLLLKNVRKDYDGADFMYRRALAREPRDPTTLCNYGLFLQNVRQVLPCFEIVLLGS